MLSLIRRPGESVLIYPAVDLDPDMTIGELFKNGPIIIRSALESSKMQIQLSIKAPDELTVICEEVGVPKMKIWRCVKAS